MERIHQVSTTLLLLGSLFLGIQPVLASYVNPDGVVDYWEFNDFSTYWSNGGVIYTSDSFSVSTQQVPVRVWQTTGTSTTASITYRHGLNSSRLPYTCTTHLFCSEGKDWKAMRPAYL